MLRVHTVVIRAEPGNEEALTGMEEGWSQNFDKMVELVSENRPVIGTLGQ